MPNKNSAESSVPKHLQNAPGAVRGWWSTWIICHRSDSPLSSLIGPDRVNWWFGEVDDLLQDKESIRNNVFLLEVCLLFSNGRLFRTGSTNLNTATDFAQVRMKQSRDVEVWGKRSFGGKEKIYDTSNMTSNITLPETNSSPLKIGFPKRKGSSSNHPFSGANC